MGAKSMSRAGWLTAALAAATLAHEPTPYMGEAQDQALFDAVKSWCWTQAYEEARQRANTTEHSIGFAQCIDEAYAGKGGVYSAIVRGTKDGETVHAMTWEGETLASVTRRGIAGCEAGGVRGCTLRHFTRDGCIAYAEGTGQHGAGSGSTRAEAERTALEHCAQNAPCTIQRSSCPGEQRTQRAL